MDVPKNSCFKNCSETSLFWIMLLDWGHWPNFTIVTFPSFLNYRMTCVLDKEFKRRSIWLLIETELWQNLRDCYQFYSKRSFWKTSKKFAVKFLDREITVTIWEQRIISFLIVSKSSVDEKISKTVLPHFSKDPVA